jgi:hypothetical protein
VHLRFTADPREYRVRSDQMVPMLPRNRRRSA